MPRTHWNTPKSARAEGIPGLNNFVLMQLLAFGPNPPFKLDPAWIDDMDELRALWPQWREAATALFNDPAIDGSHAADITLMEEPVWGIGVGLPPFMEMERLSRNLDELPDADDVTPLPAADIPPWATIPGGLSDTTEHGCGAYHTSRMMAYFPEVCRRHPITRQLWAALQ